MRLLLRDSLNSGIIYRRTILPAERFSNIYQCNQRFFQGVERITPTATFSTTSLNPNKPDQPSPSPPTTRKRQKWRFDPHDAERKALRNVSRETRDLMPGILSSTTQHPPDGFLMESQHVPQLQKEDCPGFTDVNIKVFQMDAVDAAVALAAGDSIALKDTSNPDAKTSQKEDYGRPCVLSISNGTKRGGLWAHGARTQEESICRRSTLRESLQHDFYPLPLFGAIYSPSIVVFRQSVVNRHHLMNLDAPDALPVISVISMSPVRMPTVITERDPETGSVLTEEYLHPEIRDVMKEKMRIILRISAMKGNRRIVLGAFGCGALKNPKGQVADCWAEVFGEPEFQGGWWKDVVFAVLDPPLLTGDNVSVWNERRTAPTFVKRLDGLKI